MQHNFSNFRIILSLFVILMLQSCQNSPREQLSNNKNDQSEESTFVEEVNEFVDQVLTKDYPTFDRSVPRQKIEEKIANNELLQVHVFVPLCDNDNQGIYQKFGVKGATRLFATGW